MTDAVIQIIKEKPRESFSTLFGSQSELTMFLIKMLERDAYLKECYYLAIWDEKSLLKVEQELNYFYSPLYIALK